MSAATLDICAAPSRRGWRSLYWVAPIAGPYIALTFAVPAINSGVLTVFIRLAIQALIAVGLWIGLERSELTPSQGAPHGWR